MQAEIDRLICESVISPNEANEVEKLVSQGKVSEATAIRYLSRIESIRSMTRSERSRYGTLYILGETVSGSGHVCRIQPI